VFEDGAQTRDFVHVDDVARANVIALTSGRQAAGAYNIASGDPHTVGEMAAALASASGGRVVPVVSGRWRIGDVRHIVASSARAERELDFRAEIGFERGMAEFATAPLGV
jgi:dTDP-L-rhamnose 4-epimerase